MRAFNSQILSIRDDLAKLKGSVDSILSSDIAFLHDNVSYLTQAIESPFPPPTQSHSRRGPTQVSRGPNSKPLRPHSYSRYAFEVNIVNSSSHICSDTFELRITGVDSSNSPLVIGHLIEGLFIDASLPVPDFEVAQASVSSSLPVLTVQLPKGTNWDFLRPLV